MGVATLLRMRRTDFQIYSLPRSQIRAHVVAISKGDKCIASDQESIAILGVSFAPRNEFLLDKDAALPPTTPPADIPYVVFSVGIAQRS